jgi:hypothetical protein
VLEEGAAEIRSSLIRTSAKTGIAVRQAKLLVTESVITENNSGGFLLENSQARIAQNNIANNGGWTIKVLDDHSQVTAGYNWWGEEKPDHLKIIGSVTIQPLLNKPIDFPLLE